MSTGVRELKLWQEAVALGGEVARHARQHARRETRAFTDQLLGTALAVATSVADGYGRPVATEQRDCYRRAKRFLAELETALAVARHADLVSPTALSQLSLRIASVNRLLAGYLAFIERQVIAEAAVAEGAATRGGTSAAARSPEPHGAAPSVPLPAA
ncbi:MAG TPA: four helix bundle protein [Gemmatimonadaceae bacterium]|nr:four helix bundle protein [Gemmatimonadaceae bacterium]